MLVHDCWRDERVLHLMFSKLFSNTLDQTQRIKVFFISFVLSAGLVYFYDPFNNIDIDSWDRSISYAVMGGISVDQRIFRLLFGLCFVYPITIMLLHTLLTKLFEVRKDFIDTFLSLDYVFAASIFCAYISRFSNDERAIIVDSVPLLVLTSVFHFVLIILAIINKENVLQQDAVASLYLFLLTACIILSIVFQNEINWAIVSTAAFFSLILGIAYIKSNDRNGSTIVDFIRLFVWAPALIVVIREAYYFFINAGGVYHNFYTLVCFLSALFFGGCILIALISNRRVARIASKISQEVGDVGAIISMGMVSFIPNAYAVEFSYDSYNNIYEVSNGAVVWSSLNGGKLPIIDYFSSHALSDLLDRFVYGLFFGSDNVYSRPYVGLYSIAGALIMYFILKKIFENSSFAVLMALTFPIFISNTKITGICFLSVLCFIIIVKNSSWRNFVLYWICSLLGALFRYDEGISLMLGGIIVYLTINILQRKWDIIRRYIASGCIVGCILFVVYSIYAIATHIPIIGRIREWYSLSINSLNIWANKDLGDISSFQILFSYVIAPGLCVVILVIVGYTIAIRRKCNLLSMLVVLFSVAELLNIPRGLVFHTYQNTLGRSGVLLNFFHWTVALFIIWIFQRFYNSKKMLTEAIFVITFMGTLLIEATCVNDLYPNIQSTVANVALVEAKEIQLSNDNSELFGVRRNRMDNSTIELTDSFREIFDCLLDDDETFLDFANMTCLYPLTGRKRPCYACQSPGSLTDLYSQDCFISEVENAVSPLAVMSNCENDHTQTLAAIPLNLRYYRVAEYIYNNYRPFVMNGDFAIWCRDDRFEKYMHLYASNTDIQNKYPLIDYGYDPTEITETENGGKEYSNLPFHVSDLGQIPFLWANYDEDNAIENQLICDVENCGENVFAFKGSQFIDRSKGNYLSFRIVSDEEANGKIVLCDSNNPSMCYVYNFLVNKGEFNYMMRISEDYFWHAFNIDRVTTYFEYDNASIKEMSILEGD